MAGRQLVYGLAGSNNLCAALGPSVCRGTERGVGNPTERKR